MSSKSHCPWWKLMRICRSFVPDLSFLLAYKIAMLAVNKLRCLTNCCGSSNPTSLKTRPSVTSVLCWDSYQSSALYQRKRLPEGKMQGQTLHVTQSVVTQHRKIWLDCIDSYFSHNGSLKRSIIMRLALT